MNIQFCKVGLTKYKSSHTKELKKQYLWTIERAYSLSMTNDSFSDILYHEASKMKALLSGTKGTAY